MIIPSRYAKFIKTMCDIEEQLERKEIDYMEYLILSLNAINDRKAQSSKTYHTEKTLGRYQL